MTYPMINLKTISVNLGPGYFHACFVNVQIVPSGRKYTIKTSSKFQGYVTDRLELFFTPRRDTVVYLWNMSVKLCCLHPPNGKLTCLLLSVTY